MEVGSSELPNLPPTSWAVLGMLAFGEEVKDIDEADTAFREGQRSSQGAFPTPRPGHWREVEQRVQETDPDRP
jgi:hypothetical protein